MIIGTAGHIDHGKTALVRALTGVDADRLPEEKARGITIDIGFAYQAISSAESLGFVDVPGHERFVHNMLAGAIGILSLFAPSGLGVREAIQLLLLPRVIPAEIALVVTVAARIWSIAVDALASAARSE